MTKPEGQAIEGESGVLPPLVNFSAMPNEKTLQFLARHYTPRVVKVTSADGVAAEVLLLPGEYGFRLEPVAAHIDAQRERPRFRRGTAALRDLTSFIAYVNRFRDEHSLLFGYNDPQKLSLTCVFDHHEALRHRVHEAKDDKGFATTPAGWRETAKPRPRFGQHRAHYQLPLSKEWKAWTAIANGEPLQQREFAEFIEDHIVDVLDPGRVGGASSIEDGDGGKLTLTEVANLLGGSFANPKRLMELSRGLKIAAAVQGGQVVNTSSGEIDVTYKEEHFEGGSGAAPTQKLRVEQMFLIGIPVFEMGARYQLPVQLRYRLRGGSVYWSFEIWRMEKAVDNAFAEACTKAVTDTGLQLVLGSPEA